MIWSVYSSDVTTESFNDLKYNMILDDFLVLKQLVDMHEDYKIAHSKDQELQMQQQKPKGRK